MPGDEAAIVGKQTASSRILDDRRAADAGLAPVTSELAPHAPHAAQDAAVRALVLHRCAVATRAAGLLAAAAGVVVLAGWLTDVAGLRAFASGVAPMRPWAAVGIVCAGLAVALSPAWPVARRDRRIASFSLAAVAALIGLVAIVEWLTNWDPGMDRLLFPGPALDAVAPYPGRMAQVAAAALTLVALGVLAQGWGRLAFAQLLEFVALYSVLAALLGYLYGVDALHRVGSEDIALNSAIAFAVLSAGALAQTVGVGVLRQATAPPPAGTMLRRLAPAGFAVVIVLLVSAVVLRDSGVFGPAAADAYLALAIVTALGGAFYLSARQLAVTDSQRRGAQDALRALNESLETEVAERTLRLAGSEARFRRAFENAPHGMAVAGMDGSLLSVNSRLCEITGFSQDELLGRDMAALTYPDDRGPASVIIERLAAGEVQTAAGEVRLLHKTGRPVDAEVRLGRVNATGDEPGQVIVHLEDVTPLKRERQLFNTFFEASPDLQCIAGFNGYFLRLNPAWQRILGWTLEELRSAPFQEFILPEDVERTAQVFRAQVEAGEEVVHFTNRYRCRDGSLRWLDWNAVTLADLDLIIANARDVTDARLQQAALQRANVELTRSNADLEQFAYVASHDLQEPLRMVASFTELLADEYGDSLDERAAEYIGYASDGARRMQRLVLDLLEFSRVGSRPTQLRRVDTEDLFKVVSHDLEAALRDSGGTLEHGPLPTVRADPATLTQVFSNLVLNALKFHGDEPPRVRVSAERVEDGWRFGVADNGIGIAPAYYERVFELFRRLHGRRDYPGTGMGLAICKKVVELHGGRIWVESSQGAGSTFYFTVPAYGPDNSEEANRP